MPNRSFFDELKRRQVYRAAAVYAGTAFVVIQVAELTFPTLGLGRWAYDLVVLLALAGFPVALVLAWMFDVSRDGVQRESPYAGGRAGSGRTGTRKWRRMPLVPLAALVAVLVTVSAGFATWWQQTRNDVDAGASDGEAGSIAATRDSLAPILRPIVAAPEGMALIGAGTYAVGHDDGRGWDGPRHEVTLPAFAIGLREVTVGEYRAFVRATDTPAPWSGARPDALPVTAVFQPEADAYCAWRYERGRLPTEAEWEAAARGPSGALRTGGNANTAAAGRGGPLPADRDDNRDEGLRDMIGNVWEWTRSPMLAYPGGSAPDRGERYFVIRGGAWDTPDASAHAAYRGYLPPTTANRRDFAATGFRCAVPLER